jgi:hypothetical protein
MTTKLADRQEIAEGTMAFHFEKPPGWTFEAGQAVDITVVAPSETDAEGNTRTFTIASAPYEKNLMVATRMRDTAFKRMLKVMAVGTAVQMEGPAGDLTLHNDAARTAVFLSGVASVSRRSGALPSPRPKKISHTGFSFSTRTGGLRMRHSWQNYMRWRSKIPITSSSEA